MPDFRYVVDTRETFVLNIHKFIIIIIQENTCAMLIFAQLSGIISVLLTTNMAIIAITYTCWHVHTDICRLLCTSTY